MNRHFINRKHTGKKDVDIVSVCLHFYKVDSISLKRFNGFLSDILFYDLPCTDEQTLQFLGSFKEEVLGKYACRCPWP